MRLFVGYEVRVLKIEITVHPACCNQF